MCPKIAVMGVTIPVGMTRWIIAIVTAVVFASAATGVQNPLRDRLLRNDRSEEAIGWFQRADTGEFFQFDRSATPALLRERDDPSSEVFVLFANRAPGGGTAYVTDTGYELLRITGLGGATYFPVDAPNGVIAEYASPAGSLAPTPRSPEEVRSQAEELANEFADQFNRDIAVDYAPAPRAGLGVQYDALQMMILAIQSLPDRRRARGIDRISLQIGSQPAAYRQEDALVVEIAPEFGFAGRPSSALIVQAIMGDDV